jgi:outer membrane autotransporter protein
MSCQQAGGEYRFTREGSCVWGRWVGQERTLDAHGDYKRINADTTRLSLGGQKTLESDWTLGGGFARDRTYSNGYDGLWSSDTLAYQLGLSVKRRWAGTKLGAALSYGWSDTDTLRRGTLVESFMTEVSRDMSTLSLLLRAQHDFELNSWYLRPKLDFGITHLKAKDAQEEGLAGVGLTLEGFNETHTWLRPALELGKEFEIGEEYWLRFNLEFGAQYYLNETATEVQAGFSGLPDSVAPMRVESDLGDPRYGASFGVDFIADNGVLLELLYRRDWTDYRDTDTIQFKLEYPLR